MSTDDFNMGNSFRFKARDNGITSKRIPQGQRFDHGEETPKRDHAKESLRDQVIHSFDHLQTPRLQGGAGVRIREVPQDPYENVHDMVEDMRKNRQIQVPPDWMQNDDKPAGRPKTKMPSRLLDEEAAKPQQANDISTDPAKRSQQNHITNRYRAFSASRPTRNY